MKLVLSKQLLPIHAIIATEEEAKKHKLLKQHFTGADDETLVVVIDGKKQIWCGLGKEKKVTLEKIRRTASSLIQLAKQQKISAFSVQVFSAHPKEKTVFALTEGFLLMNHSFDKYHKVNRAKRVKEVRICEDSSFKKQIEKATILCNNVLFTRDILNDSPSVMNPDAMETIAKTIAEKDVLKLTVVKKATLQKKGLNLLLAVGKGAEHDPRLIILEYNGNKKSKERIALVGKGITFDSGGINLKPTGYIEDMKVDKAGAVSVLATMKSIAELKVKVNVIGVMPFCENAISHTAYKPGDILTSYSGKTVEIANTDAEGRLILADALSYAIKHYAPTYIVDMATLTGAALSITGEFVAPCFSNDDVLVKKLFDAGEEVFERVWRLPLYEEFEKDDVSRVADLANVAKSRHFGSIAGALFLKSFIGDIPWVHVDMSPALSGKPRWYLQQGCTGWGVRLLVNFIESFEK